MCLCFLLGGLSIGCVLQVVQERYITRIPYTCLLFVTGVLIATIHYIFPRTWSTWFVSVEMWEHVDPHLVFYIFLPVLIFAEAMRVNVKLASKLFKQVMLLACPGVLIGTGLTAAFSRYVLPYNWCWTTSLVFGSILSATDPVAVVALFNTLGVSARLTMLISGESLLNDGTAIVCFTLMLKLLLGGTVSAGMTVLFFLKMTVGAVIVGTSLALVSLVVISWCAESKYHTDNMIQVVATICCAFLCFFLAESEIVTSGVLAVVTAGSIFAYGAWPQFASRETMEIVWEAIEFIGNTVIFLLAGLLFGHRVVTRTPWLHGTDVFWLLLLYVAVTVIRAFMIVLLWPLLNILGQKVKWKEVIVMVWSGLRGAVGLVLAIAVDLEESVDPRVGAQMMFHVGGIAMLTILVNATLAAPLLRVLGLTKTPEIEEKTVKHFKRLMEQHTRETFQVIVNNQEDPRFVGANMAIVQATVPWLGSRVAAISSTFDAMDHNHDGTISRVEFDGAAPAISSTFDAMDYNHDGTISRAEFDGILMRNALDDAYSEEDSSSESGGDSSSSSSSIVELSSPVPVSHALKRGQKAAKLRTCREIFMRAVQHSYWVDIEGGIIPRIGQVARVLLHSTEAALENSKNPLSDWDSITDNLSDRQVYPLMSRFTTWPVLDKIVHVEEMFPSKSIVTLWQVYAALSYIEAHQRAQVEVPEFFGPDSVLGDPEVQQQVAFESRRGCEKAAALLEELPVAAVELCKSRMLAGKLLQKQVEEVDSMKQRGFLTDKGAARLMHHVQHAQRDLAGLTSSAMPR